MVKAILRGLLLLSLMFSWVSPLQGEVRPFEVRYVGPGGPPAEVALESSNANDTVALLLELDRRGHGTLEISLEAGPWLLSCSSPELWCLPFSLDQEAFGAPHQLTVYPAGRLEGRLEASGSLPKRIQIQGWAASEHATVTFGHGLSIEAGKFAFKAPAIPLDLRLAFPGWAPVYLWQVEPDPKGSVNLGALRLRAGASLCAFVVEEATGLPAVGARVLLRAPPPSPGISSVELARVSRMQWETTVNDRGFFQISEAFEGSFQLELTRAVDLNESLGEPSLLIENVALASAAETCLDDIYLPEKDPLTVRLTPTRAPDEKPWLLTLTKARGSSGRPIQIEADDLGMAHFSLADGDYSLLVSAVPGKRILRRAIVVEGPTEVAIDMDLVLLRGSLKLGGKPLVAAIRLTGGGIDSSFESDFEGAFEGWIQDPRGNALVAHIESALPPFSRWLELGVQESDEGTIGLDLDLENGFLEGLVRDTEGRALRRATVVAMDDAGKAVETLSDVEGRFRLEGLGAERVRVWATLSDYGSSETQKIELQESGPPSEVVLTLSPGLGSAGRLLAASGQPVAGARISIRFPGHLGWLDTVSSGADGSFDFRAPEGALRAMLTVSASAVGMLWSICSTLPSEGELTLRMPQAPSGTIRLVSKPGTGGGPAPGAGVAVITSDGGLLTEGDLGRWVSQLGFHEAEEEPGTRLIPGIAPAFYQLTRTSTASLELGCHNGMAGGQWRQLAAGGELTFQLD